MDQIPNIYLLLMLQTFKNKALQIGVVRPRISEMDVDIDSSAFGLTVENSVVNSPSGPVRAHLTD